MCENCVTIALMRMKKKGFPIISKLNREGKKK